MIGSRDLRRNLAADKVDLTFYLVSHKSGKKLLKPVTGCDTQISLKLVRAILDDTVIPTFYETLSLNLIDRGIPSGSKVQLRAKFKSTHAMLDPQLTGTKVLCEVNIR